MNTHIKKQCDYIPHITHLIVYYLHTEDNWQSDFLL